MQLTPHFSLEELVTSQTAARLGLDNTPGANEVRNLKRLAIMLERIRIVLNSKSIHVNSGYRCEAVERELTYTAYLTRCQLHGIHVSDATWTEYFLSKDHPKGRAADIICPTFGDPKKVMQAIVGSDIDFDQCIYEFGSWIHVSWSDKPRKQALIIDKEGTRPWKNS